ncbi:MAG: isopenicillin N synthase family oxygenase [Deltaproteobacteria bacterium]|nr:isopenicillin N synthase family oxygenase [Deltaproteobacteria bacterium]
MNILKVDFREKNASFRFAESLQKTGFGVVTHHPISASLIQSVYDDWKKFFANEAKHNYLYDKKAQVGYFPFASENAKDSPIKDLKEFYHIYPGHALPKEVSERSLELFNELMKLGKILLDWLDEQTPSDIRSEFSMPLSKMVKESPKNLFRIIHYPPLSGQEPAGAIRAAAHEDINIITLLPASTAMGLQVKDVAGQWHDVPGDWGDIVINVGDMLQMASQKFYKSTTHRVVNPSGEAAKLPRYSMPLFLHPTPEVRLSETHTADSYLTERLREIGLK